MGKILKILNPAALVMITAFIALIIINPTACTQGAIKGILICGNVIIPSLFPFTVCVMFIVKSQAAHYLKPFSRITKFVFGIDCELFLIMLLSLIGGYPVGARLLNELTENKKITPENAGVMLNYCINAGPAFIVLAVGYGILDSKVIGYILLFSHLCASLIIAVFSKKFLSSDVVYEIKVKKTPNFADNLVESVSNAASSVIGICGYVILFSTINSYIELYSEKFAFLKILGYFTEVTNGVMQTNNILFVSFLLGFSGICVWCQVLANSGGIKINYPMFIVFRILHGILSLIITYLLFKILKIPVQTFSNGKSFDFSPYHTSLAVGLSIVILGIIFIISLYSQKKSGNILKDLV